MDIAIHMRTYFLGVLVGKDEQGNSYYRERRWRLWGGSKRRWVMYRDEEDASKVPAQWHGWLHYTTDALPSELTIPDYAWLKPHLPNQTGSMRAWRRQGSLLDEKRREDATGDYQAWSPSQAKQGEQDGT